MNEAWELLEYLEIDDLKEKERELAEVIGMEAYRALVKAYGGSEAIYVPKADRLVLPIRNQLILREFDGYNADLLGRKYHLTERYIRLLTAYKKKKIKQAPLEGQASLFDQQVLETYP